MPDTYVYTYNRMLDGEFKIDNPERTVIEEPTEKADIDNVQDASAKLLFQKIFPQKEVMKTLAEEVSADATIGSAFVRMEMSNEDCFVHFNRGLTTEEVSILDGIVEAHKNNS